MHRDVIRVRDQGVQTRGPFDVAGQTPGGFNRDKGVVAADFHTQGQGIVGDHHTDGTQANDTQFLALDFGPGKLGLTFFDELGHFGPFASQALGPTDAVDDFAGRQEQGHQHQFLDAVGIGAGGVEDHDAFVRTFVDGDIVDSGPGPAHGLEAGGQFHVVHLEATQDDGVSGLGISEAIS